MGYMKRLTMIGYTEEFWRVLPSLGSGDNYRLMEHIGKGRWVQRQEGLQGAMETLADLYNREDYKTPLSKTEVCEVRRFSLMESLFNKGILL